MSNIPHRTLAGRYAAVAVMIAMPLTAASPARADQIAWDNYFSSTLQPVFEDAGSWAGDVAPGASDTALFDLPAAYPVYVDFDQDITNTGMTVRQGVVSFTLSNNQYTLSDPGGSGILLVGIDGQTAGLNIEQGTFVDDQAYIGGYSGLNPNGTGTVTVSGPGTVWTNTILTVGFTGDGTVNIEDGGRVNSFITNVGIGNNAHGTVKVTGTDSTLHTNSLTIGSNLTGSESGTLNINAGGNVFVESAFALNDSGTFHFDGGTLRFDGYSVDAGAVIDYTAGTIQLAGDRTLDTDAAVADFFGATPTVADGKGLTIEGDATLGTTLNITGGTVSADSLSLTSAATLHFHGGTLQMGTYSGQPGATIDYTAGTVELGGSHSADDAAITAFFGDPPTVGAGKALAVEQNLSVGSDTGTTLRIEGGGQVSNGGNGRIGADVHTIGKMIVTGEGSTWTSGSTVLIGYQGSGTLDITDGGRVNSTLNAEIGTYFPGNGTVTVSGTGSLWDIDGSLQMSSPSENASNSGTATLTIADGGEVRVGGTLSINNKETLYTQSTLNLEGGTLWLHGYQREPLSVINFTSGTLGLYGNRTLGADTAVADFFGPSLTISSGKALIVEGQATLDAPIAVSGGHLNAGSMVNNSELTIENGGTATIGNQFTLGDNAAVHLHGGTLGFKYFTGNSSATIDYTAGTVHLLGRGLYRVIEHTAGITTLFGHSPIVGDGQTLMMDDQFVLGENDNAAFGISAGGTVSTPRAIIAHGDVLASVNVDGADAYWDAGSSLIVGDEGHGILTVSNGGGGASGGSAFSVADQPDSIGEVTITGTGSHWTHNGDFIVGNQGHGSLTVADHATLDTTSTVYAIIGDDSNATGDVAVTGGAQWTIHNRLIVGNQGHGSLTITDGASVSNSYAEVGRSSGSVGTVTVTGEGSTWTNSASVSVRAGSTVTLGPGGTINIATLINFDPNAMLSLNLAASNDTGVIHTDDASLGDDVTLAVAFMDGYHPGLNQQFLFLDVDGTLTGTFTGLAEGGLVGTFGGTNLFITYAAGDGNDLALFTVPEPGTLALLGLAGLALLTRRRGRHGMADGC